MLGTPTPFLKGTLDPVHDDFRCPQMDSRRLPAVQLCRSTPARVRVPRGKKLHIQFCSGVHNLRRRIERTRYVNQVVTPRSLIMSADGRSLERLFCGLLAEEYARVVDTSVQESQRGSIVSSRLCPKCLHLLSQCQPSLSSRLRGPSTDGCRLIPRPRRFSERTTHRTARHP